jgi:serine/threonine protein kinase
MHKYTLIEEVGSGGMAKVYRAIRQPGGVVIAIKILHPHLADNPIAASTFEIEANSVRYLEHPNIVKIYEIGRMNGLPYIAMDYVKSETLEEKIKHFGRFDLYTALYIARQMAFALDYAHSKNIVHLDVKPQNILVDENWNAYITDFGIARAKGDYGRDDVIIGTPEYMPPEQFEGSPADQRSDVYALAMVLFKMLVGKIPYKSTDFEGIRREKISSETPSIRKYIPNLDSRVDYFIQKALKKNLNNRFVRASDFIKEIDILLAGTVGKITEPDPWLVFLRKFGLIAILVTISVIIALLLIYEGGF